MLVDEELNTIRFVIKDPRGMTILESSGQIALQDRSVPERIFGVNITNVLFAASGTYEILVGLDEEPTPVWDFTVRLPKDRVESERIKMI